ncbi:hypothetical protein [Paraburkholderia sp. J41]|uniref:hypothetical protein n=1 Tax=Paraburkholderia sp. J41 TaxID=2805433 RepID=UPI002AC32DA4|nr:hypothetical protein [Paraburkholderia sp. J41]
MLEYLVPVCTPEYLLSHPSLMEGKLSPDVEFLHDGAPWDGAPEFVEWHTWARTCMPEWINRIGGPQFTLSSLAISAALNHQGVAMGRTALIQEELRTGRLVKALDMCATASARYVLLCSLDERRSALVASWLMKECQRFESTRIGCERHHQSMG